MKDIKETLKEVDAKLGNAVVIDAKDSLNYAMPILTKLYAEINPNITTISSNNIIYFNSSEEYEDNAYPMEVIDKYKNASATHTNLIDLKRNLLIGGGLIPVGGNTTGNTATQAFLDKENSYGQSLQDIWEMLCFDYALFESYGLQVIYDGNGLITETYHVDPSIIRAKASVDPNMPYTDTWYLSRQWAKISNKMYKRYTVANSGTPIANFNPNNWAKDGGRQLLYCKRYTAGNDIYSIPTYQSILGYVELDYQLSKYHLNKVAGGFFPNVIVNLPGNPDDETKAQFVNKFKQRYQGADKEKIMFVWSNNSDEKPEIIPFSTNDDSQIFLDLNTILTQKIASGHGASPELAGVTSNAGATLGGDANKISVSYALFVERNIKPMQKQMLTSLNKIFKLNGLQEVTVETPPLNLGNAQGQNKVA